MKEIFKTKEKKTDATNLDTANLKEEKSEIEEAETYYQWGKRESLQSSGNAIALKVSLDNIYHRYIESCKKDQEQQERDKKPLVEELSNLNGELNKQTAILEIKESRLNEKNDEIRRVKVMREDVPNNPVKHGITSHNRPRAQFYIGLIILIFLFVNLLVFYSSATYSALFKQLNATDTSLINSLFDGQAIYKAFSDGIAEGVFITTVPFIFMGLGYLIHMFGKEGRTGRLKVVGLFLVNFVFDCILAFMIDKKYFDVTATLEDKFNLSIALSSANFWVIIFLGFISYAIWGLVFDFVMKEWENIDKIKQKQKSYDAHIEDLELERDTLQKEIDSIKSELPILKEKIQKLNNSLNSFFFSEKRYKLFHTEYVKGWIHAIASQMNDNSSLIENCYKVSEAHYSELGIDSKITT